MPELPDLQAFSANLNKRIVDKVIKEVVVNTKKLNVPSAKLNERLQNQKVKQVFREGKELHLQFEQGDVLGLHLMLHGELHFVQEQEPVKFSVVELIFVDGWKFVLSDFQKQATPTLNPEPDNTPDALSAQIDFAFLKSLLATKKAVVKNILLDQHLIRGIGNAYADEILWDAKISPFSVSNQIPEDAVKQLVKSIKHVLTTAEKQILKEEPDIISGEIRDFLKIHKAKQIASPSGGKILVQKTGSRKTYYTEEQILYN
ncbi:MAG: DNA-formamidopyrimidine glycosylase [Pedobacter sp.]|nr:DNA-formamidopyrimidine glycosylase [Pedobacter sp.]